MSPEYDLIGPQSARRPAEEKTPTHPVPVVVVPQSEPRLIGPYAPPGGNSSTNRAENQAPTSSRAARRGGRATAPVESIPDELRQIPAPGGRYRGGRGRHVALKSVGVVSVCALAVGGAFVAGLNVAGRLATPPTFTITTGEATRYGLDDFPIAAAAAFAERYVTLCLSTPVDQASETARTTQLRALSTTGVPSSCGVDPQAPGMTVTSAAFAGVRGPVPDRPSARFIAVQTALSDGRVIDVTVPVWTDPADPGRTFTVVGAIGNDPLPGVGAVDKLPPARLDADLGSTLKTEVFAEFFGAWGSSNAAVLERFATSDATAAVMTGLGGALGAPEVADVAVMLPSGESTTYEWKDGDETTAQVQVKWTLPGASAGQAFTYRVDLIRTAGTWSVQDINGGGVDPAGSNPDSTADSIPAARPSPAPTTEK